MKNIPLSVLDEYAKKLSFKLANKLYEAKTNKKYAKQLFEGLNDTYQLYLNAYTIMNESGKTKLQYLMDLSEANPNLMNAISYKINEDAITFTTDNRYTYTNLLEAVKCSGISAEVVESIRDEKF